MTIGLGASSDIPLTHFLRILVSSAQPPSSFAGLKVMLIPLFFLMFIALLRGQASLASTSPSTGTVPDQISVSESAATTPGTRNADEYRYSVLQTRCARLEQDLRATRGVLAILRSKQPRPAEREAFLLE